MGRMKVERTPKRGPECKERRSACCANGCASHSKFWNLLLLTLGCRSISLSWSLPACFVWTCVNRGKSNFFLRSECRAPTILCSAPSIPRTQIETERLKLVSSRGGRQAILRRLWAETLAGSSSFSIASVGSFVSFSQ